MELRHTPRLFIDTTLEAKRSVEPGAEQSHYLQHVLRIKTGDVVRLFNGRDGEWKATVASLTKKSVTLLLHEQTRPQQAEPNLWLCAAPIKKAHFDYMIEKATELGIAAILTARTQIRDVNVERCRAIAIEAAEQSERLTIPEIRKPVTLSDLVASWPSARRLVVCAEWGEATPIGKALNETFAIKAMQHPSRLREGLGEGWETPDNFTSPPASGRAALEAAILTGPEGGLAAEELEKLRALSAAIFVRLGPRILRADTAAIAALTCWQAQCGDWQ